jgi:uncharacterized SAM-binding protein YcdF (DUF218 family)
MTTVTIFGLLVVALLGAWVLLFVVRRAVRMAVRLMLLVLLLLALGIGGLWMWWRSSSSAPAAQPSNARPASTRPARTR